MPDKIEHRQTFEAVDAEGRRHTLHVFQKVRDVGRFHDPGKTAPGLKYIVNDDGDAVNHEAKGVYQVVGGPRLTSDDPNAP